MRIGDIHLRESRFWEEAIKVPFDLHYAPVGSRLTGSKFPKIRVGHPMLCVKITHHESELP